MTRATKMITIDQREVGAVADRVTEVGMDTLDAVIEAEPDQEREAEVAVGPGHLLGRVPTMTVLRQDIVDILAPGPVPDLILPDIAVDAAALSRVIPPTNVASETKFAKVCTDKHFPICLLYYGEMELRKGMSHFSKPTSPTTTISKVS